MKIQDGTWRDGKPGYLWPSIDDHIGWSVMTAGTVNLDLEDRTPMFNTGRTRILPPNFPMILKDVRDGMAYAYNHNEGVIRVPVELLRPLEK